MNRKNAQIEQINKYIYFFIEVCTAVRQQRDCKKLIRPFKTMKNRGLALRLTSYQIIVNIN
jgi:hypothetical protein